MNKQKHHYREASKSDHLAKEDIVGLPSPVVLHVDHCEWFNSRKISGTNKQNCMVAFFADRTIKPWVINQTNAKIIAKEIGSQYVEDWGNLKLEFYVDNNVKMMGEVVGGIKIRPCAQVEVMNKKHGQWSMAVTKVKDGMSFEEINSYFSVSQDVYKQLTTEAGAK